MIYEFKINRLDIRESYFLGKIQLAEEEYTVNIQTERRGKVLKLPFGIHPKNQKVLVQMTGQNGVTIEDILP